MADMRKQAASSALEKEGASRALTQQERFDATKSGLPMEHFQQALIGAAPVPTTEESILPSLAVGAAAAAPVAGTHARDKARPQYRARDAADVSDIHNTQLDKEYYRAMGKAGGGTKQMQKGVDRLDYTPGVSADGGTIDAPYMGHDRPLPARDELGISETAYQDKMGKKSEIYGLADEAEWRNSTERLTRAEEDAAYKKSRNLQQDNLARGMDDVFEGAAKNTAAKGRMAELRKIGKVALKTAYVGPWLAMAEAAGGAAAIPFMASDNYMKIKDPAQQIRFVALHGVQRPLRPGDLSPTGLAWLDSHTPQTNALYRQGILDAELYQALMRPEGLEAAKQEAQAAYDAAEKYTPSKEEIQGLSKKK